MGILMVILIIVILGVVVAGVALGLFKIEKVVVVEGQTLDPARDEPEDEPGLDLDDGVSLKEKMNLDKYFDEDGEAGEAGETEWDSGPGEFGEADPPPAENQKFYEQDGLTEFRVGRSYRLDCQKELNEAREQSRPYAAAYFDFDRFRFINSLKGFSIGDYVLTKLGQELESAFPPGAKLTRISADHFAAVFPGDDIAIFEGISQRLVEICEKVRGDIAIKSGLRVCMGVAFAENGTVDYDLSVLLHKANVARHCIKVSRNEVFKEYEPAMLSTFLYGESALDDYNENQFDDEFVIHYTPQENIAVHQIVGGEALVRWSCEDDAEKTLPVSVGKGKIPTNSSKVVYQVCKAMSRWRKAGKQVLPVSVSIPITELYKEDIDAFLAKCLSEFQLEPSMLAIVVDAAMVRVDWSTMAHQLKKIRNLGCKVGVDEIDTSYTSLDFLGGLPINFIKLHSSFVLDIEESEEQCTRVRTMLSLAAGLNFKVIVEGVDTHEQAGALMELGAKNFQGLACGRPLRADEFLMGLPVYVERHSADTTVILEDAVLNKGDFNLY